MFVIFVYFFSFQEKARLSKIRFICDVDGFYVDKKFRCRELAVYDRIFKRKICFHFSVGHFNDLSEKDKKTVNYVRRNIHGLKYTNRCRNHQNISMALNSLQDVIEGIGRHCSLRDKEALIAYKGGDFERRLFEKYNIRNIINLEQWGCPKFEKLLLEFGNGHVKDFDCGEHEPLRNGKVAHCPAVETYYFNLWVQSLLDDNHCNDKREC